MFRMLLTACLTAALLPAVPALHAAAQTPAPEVAARKACPDGWAWDPGRKKCVPIPRGSHQGN